MKLQFGRHQLDLSRAHVMGILNVTPDSFYDGGKFYRSGDDISNALKQAEAMVSAGASFIDVGGESTRPGAEPVSLQEELDRVVPVVEVIAKELDVVVSLDTSSPEVMYEGAKVGAGLVNDVRALQKDGALKAASETGLPVCLMHMKGQPKTMQENPSYEEVVTDVREFFEARINMCEDAGIARSQIILDPGFGFGKLDEHNLRLLKSLSIFREMGFSVLAGLSRKSILGRLLGREPQERLAGSLALAQYALQYGANILRVHDVPESVDILRLFEALQNY